MNTFLKAVAILSLSLLTLVGFFTFGMRLAYTHGEAFSPRVQAFEFAVFWATIAHCVALYFGLRALPTKGNRELSWMMKLLLFGTILEPGYALSSSDYN